MLKFLSAKIDNLEASGFSVINFSGEKFQQNTREIMHNCRVPFIALLLFENVGFIMLSLTLEMDMPFESIEINYTYLMHLAAYEPTTRRMTVR